MSHVIKPYTPKGARRLTPLEMNNLHFAVNHSEGGKGASRPVKSEK